MMLSVVMFCLICSRRIAENATSMPHEWVCNECKDAMKVVKNVMQALKPNPSETPDSSKGSG